MKILVFGIGNPGRQDDGLGPYIAEEIERRWAARTGAGDTPHPGEVPSQIVDLQIDFDSNYQLMVEDALTISEYDIVYFIDATHSDIDSFRVSPVEPSEHVAFSTHSVDPGGIVALAEQLYDAEPQVYLVEVKAHAWEIGEPFTDGAEKNAAAAIEHLLVALTNHGTANS